MGKRIKKSHKNRGKKALICTVTAVVLVIAFIVTGVGRMFIDTAKMGLDYITLHTNPQEVTADDIAKAYENRTKSQTFVLATDEDFERLRKNYQNRDDEKLNEYFDYVKLCADKLLDEEPLGYVLDDEEDSILETARAILERVICLGFMYRMTDGVQYAARCLREMKNACDFPDFHEWHFLDTAELAFAIALGTNWIEKYLRPNRYAPLAEAVHEKAFAVSEGKILSQNWWKWSKTNWNSVCWGGLAVAAMVFYNTDPEFYADFLSKAYKWSAVNFENFTPDGVYVEGSGYWEYCTSYLTYFLSTSDNFFGTDFGLSGIDGVMKLGTFPVYVTGATSVFNYGDNKAVSVGAPSLYWFSKKTSDPVVAYYQAKATVEEELQNGKGEYELARECAVGALWYDRELLEGLDTENLPLSVLMKSDASQEIAVFRSGFFGKNDTYAAIKGGYNYTNHGDLDIGTFVFDSMGERWAEDLGPADYGDAGYFVGIIGGGRWKVYAKRAEGQNTLVINPEAVMEDQYPFARAEFVTFSEDEDGGSAILDMTGAYRFKGAKSVVREFMLYDNRTSLYIHDRIDLKKPSEVCWFMHTKAEIEITDSHHAKLTKNGKTMLAELSEDSVGEFMIMPAESLKNGIDNRLKGNAEGMQKLAVRAENVKSGSIEVRLIPAK